jgi:hypothetical protein
VLRQLNDVLSTTLICLSSDSRWASSQLCWHSKLHHCWCVSLVPERYALFSQGVQTTETAMHYCLRQTINTNCQRCCCCVSAGLVLLFCYSGNHDNIAFSYIVYIDQPRGLVVRVSDYWSWGPGFDSRLCHGDFSLKGKIPMATMVWVV